MNKRQTIYVTLVAIAATAAFYSLFQVAARLAVAGGFPVVARLMVMSLLIALLRSFFDGQAANGVNLSYVLVFAISLVYDASLAVIAYEVSTLLTYTRDKKSRKLRSVLNGSLRELVLGDAALILSVAAGALLYRTPADAPVIFQWPASLVPAYTFAAVTAAVGWGLHTILRLLGDRETQRPVLRGLLPLIPGVALGAALSIVMAMSLQMVGGDALALICLAALLAARYAYSRYRRHRVQYKRIIETLSEAIEAKDPYTQGHSARVERCVLLVGHAMHLSARRLKDLRLAARLHDIGKVGIDDIMLRKDSLLDEREWRDMRKHPMIGNSIMEQIELSERVRGAVLHHHENYDGTGYPQGLKMSELPLEDSILSACAAYSAMISDRPYRPGMSVQQALDVLRTESGKQFHPAVVRAFERCAKQLQAI